jgi:signal transduction histidine kinase/CheY-like chemotaxis protein
MAVANDSSGDGGVERVRAEQVQLLYANGGFPLLATWAAAAVTGGTLIWQGAARPMTVAIWLAVMAAQTVVRLAIRASYLRANPPSWAWPRWARRYMVGVVVGGLTWGVGSLWLMPAGRFDLQLLLILVMTAVAYASLATFGSYAPAFYAFFLLTMVPSMIWSLFQGDAAHLSYSALSLIWMPTVLVLARRYNQALIQAITLQHAYAEQQVIAEQASLAKSRFLASASHDLRQPVHALGMFIGALRGHRLPAKSRDIIDHMDSSIGALDGLFTSLLDISRLDAGVTETRPYAIPVQPLLARICRDLQGEARAKGLRLRSVATSCAIQSDPVLLERVLRNIAVNAVRYTESGGVLIGCRRRGERLSLEVWDTGCGIAEEHRKAIFEEFFQVSNPDRDRAKGLGLGLAIVRRLTLMLDHPLSLETHPGKGSAFKVSIPRVNPAAVAATASAEGVLAGLPSGLIVAIDDEAAVRAAMTQLLTSWGHRVVTAATGDEALAALADCPKRPDLIICDYRLRDGENGLDVIHRLQAEYNEDIPALLVTGDTAPERIREAEASGYPLLHKPLAHARLRAAVHNLISGLATARAEAPAQTPAGTGATAE